MAITSVGKNRTYASINDLPQNQTLVDGDRILIQTDDGTALVDYSNLKIDLKHTTFETQITKIIEFTTTATSFIEQIESDFAAIQEQTTTMKNSITELEDKMECVKLMLKFIMGSASSYNSDYIQTIAQNTLSGTGLSMYQECIDSVTATQFSFGSHNLLE